MQTFIVELERNEIELIAQLLHIHLQTADSTELGQALLKSLINQAFFIEPNAHMHKVFDWSKAPESAKPIPTIYYIPFQDPEPKNE